MKKSEVVREIFHHDIPEIPQRIKGLAYAPTNIALCKYWGKRDPELNLPMTSSFSVTLPDKGTLTTLTLRDEKNDSLIINGEEIAADSAFALRAQAFLDLFRPQKKWHLQIDIQVNIPIAAGLASSASGFASLILALNDLFNWQLEQKKLSILARLGSGSAARSLWNGFVEWHAGVQPDGMDCYAEPYKKEWPELRIGILALSHQEKPISSREAMLRTVNSSLLYGLWPKKVQQDLTLMKQALHSKNFSLFGGSAESNALSMHATMLSSWPPICYFLPETIAAMQQIWALRQAGLAVFFTEDAGPNLKLLFLDSDEDQIKKHFPNLEVIKPFEAA